MRLSGRQLNRVGRGFHEYSNCIFQVFDALQKRAFIEKTVIDGDIETAIRFGVEQAIEAKLFHIFR